VKVAEAVDGLLKALRRFGEAKVRFLEAEEALERAYAKALYDGVIRGKNREEREAEARALFPGLYEELHRARVELARAEVELEAARRIADAAERL